MSGFVKSGIAAADEDEEAGKTVMDCFTPARLPALSTLAREFCVCDRWFSSVPGPTWPNRLYVHAATSDGQAANTVLHPYDMPTIFESLEAGGCSWGIYFNDFPQSLSLRRLWSRRNRVQHYSAFRRDVEANRLPNYVFIEPRYLDFLAWKANDHHPPHDVRYGEVLLTDVYNALRQSSLWERTLLVVLFDEHGGFFDRMSPPRPVPNPDGQTSADPPFAFDRLGVRVPAVLASPWIERGTVDSTVYEHASVPATLKQMFGLPAFLTARDAAAATFESVLTRDTPRTDTPRALPAPRGVGRVREQRALLQTPPDAAVAVQEAPAGPSAPLSEFQVTLVQLADVLAREGAPVPDTGVRVAACRPNRRLRPTFRGS
jgi:phospholipase C